MYVINSSLESANVVNVKRNQLSFPGNDMHSTALDSTVQLVVVAVKVHLSLLFLLSFLHPLVNNLLDSARCGKSRSFVFSVLPGGFRG